ncbi:glycoside hydrolase family 68 protein [Sphingomonas rosea]|uniref:Glycoside hydrolase family 68 protein n=1 Tax=Sphingomonas rosea TaxID=335605 RepID=A0ABP7UFY4_9SPHN
MTSAWTRAQVAAIDGGLAGTVPKFEPRRRPVGGEGRYYWDMWPIQHADGTVAKLGTREWWMALSATDRGDPGRRHFEAEIRWIERQGDAWRDRGAVLPPHAAPYEREWAGSALLDRGRLTLFFTGAGTSERPGGYQQRLFEASAPVSADGTIGQWDRPCPSITALTDDYCAADAHDGEPGRIKAFRDPAFFRDPATGEDYLVFTASLAATQSAYNGAVGLARREGEGWALLPPLVHADGVNNELERAHVVAHGGFYYLFWVTQRATFSPDLTPGPTGLYGMVATSLAGPWTPLNHGGLVLTNPATDPGLTYSWFVTREGIVSSFVDDVAGHGFGGCPAPLLQLTFDGETVRLAGTAAA